MVRKKEHMFEKKYLTPLAARVVHFLSLHENEEVHLRDMASRLGRSPSGCHTAVKVLIDLGMVEGRTVGRNLSLRIDKDDPSIKHLKVHFNILDASVILSPYKDRVLKAVLFGSCSKGEDTHLSDIDLFIISDEASEIKEDLRGVMIGNRPVRARVVDPSEVMVLREKERPFMEEVDKGIVIWRREDEGVR